MTSRPELVEDESIEIRGIPAGSRLFLGSVEYNRPAGTGLRISDVPALRCHVGLLSVSVDGVAVGEIDIRPGKLSLEAWDALRADLQQLWKGLLFDHVGETSVAATGPDPGELWRRLASVVVDLGINPVTVLATDERLVRRDRVRRASEFTKSVVMAGARGRPGIARGVAPVVSEPERALVRDCLLRLHAYALGHPCGGAVCSAVQRLLRDGEWARPSRSAVTVTHLARHDGRLRQVALVRQQLLNVDSMIIEGPGEVRLGVRGLDRLYEYWVFLRVLHTLRQALGEPLSPGFDVIGRRLVAGRVSLELRDGTEVRFAGGVTAVFTPTVSSSGRNSWLGLELAGHHTSTGLRSPSFVTPDVMVAREVAGAIEAVVIDAKYRTRPQIDPVLWETYAKYGRMRHRGRGCVQRVVVAHPHRDLLLTWPGQLALPFVPGSSHLDAGWLPDGWVAPSTKRVTLDDELSETVEPAETPPLIHVEAPSERERDVLQLRAAIHRPVGAELRLPSIKDLARAGGGTGADRSAALAIARRVDAAAETSWWEILEDLLRDYASWSLDINDGSARTPLSVIGTVLKILQDVVPWLPRPGGQLSANIEAILDEARDLGLRLEPIPGSDTLLVRTTYSTSLRHGSPPLQDGARINLRFG